MCLTGTESELLSSVYPAQPWYIERAQWVFVKWINNSRVCSAELAFDHRCGYCGRNSRHFKTGLCDNCARQAEPALPSFFHWCWHQHPRGRCTQQPTEGCPICPSCSPLSIGIGSQSGDFFACGDPDTARGSSRLVLEQCIGARVKWPALLLWIPWCRVRACEGDTC